MRYSERQHRADRIVAVLRNELNERHLAQHVDMPIDRALAAFRFDWRPPPTMAQFHRVIGALTAHIYAHALPGHAKLPPATAMAEAIELLELAYQGTHAAGYDGAVLDVLTVRGSGIDSVLARLAEIIKHRQRFHHRQWVLARHLDPLDWPLRVQIVKAILSQRSAGDADPLAGRAPAEFADEIGDLIDHDLRLQAMLEQIVAGTWATR